MAEKIENMGKGSSRGLENARQKEKRLGRPLIYDSILEQAKLLRKQGLSFRKIEKQLGVGEGTVRKKIN